MAEADAFLFSALQQSGWCVAPSANYTSSFLFVLPYSRLLYTDSNAMLQPRRLPIVFFLVGLGSLV
jgi:hypothetical protein